MRCGSDRPPRALHDRWRPAGQSNSFLSGLIGSRMLTACQRRLSLISGTASADLRWRTSPLGQGYADARLQGALPRCLRPVHQNSGSIAFADTSTYVWDMTQPEQVLSHLPLAWAALAVPPIELIELTRCSGAGPDLQTGQQWQTRSIGFWWRTSRLCRIIAQPLKDSFGTDVSPSASGTLACKTHAHDWRLRCTLCAVLANQQLLLRHRVSAGDLVGCGI